MLEWNDHRGSLFLAKSDLLLVLFEDVQFVSELLRRLERDCEEQEDVIEPGDDTVCLVAVKPNQRIV